jgi:hypothetical protein
VLSKTLLERFEADRDEIVEKFTPKRRRDFTQYKDDPVGFMRGVLKCEPWSKQREMAEACRDYRQVCVVTGNGLGKDFVTARLSLWWMFARGGLVVLTGPTERQVKEILFREIRKALAAAGSDAGLGGELLTLSLRSDTGDDCGVVGMTSNAADRLQGFHHPNLLIAVTEGQGVNDDHIIACQGCAVDANNRLFMYGNPTAPSGPLFRAAQSEHWHTLTVSALEHPNVTERKTIIPGAVSYEWCQGMLAEHGESSPIYRSRVLAQFPDDSSHFVFAREWIRKANQNYRDGVFDAQCELVKHATIGIDVAASQTGDETVAAIVTGPRFERFVTWREQDVTRTADRIAQLSRDWTRGYPPKIPLCEPSLICDKAGPGTGLPDDLRNRHKLYCEGYLGGSKPRARQDGKEFLNLRAQSYWLLRELMEKGLVAFPPDRLLEEEMQACEWQFNSQQSDKIQILSKDQIRRELGRSPDRLDALVMAYWSAFGTESSYYYFGPIGAAGSNAPVRWATDAECDLSF